ncbi:hypothetical protein D3C87_1625430 [compost metagenome]
MEDARALTDHHALAQHDVLADDGGGVYDRFRLGPLITRHRFDERQRPRKVEPGCRRHQRMPLHQPCMFRRDDHHSIRLGLLRPSAGFRKAQGSRDRLVHRRDGRYRDIVSQRLQAEVSGDVIGRYRLAYCSTHRITSNASA